MSHGSPEADGCQMETIVALEQHKLDTWQGLLDALRDIKSELGVPNGEYPANVANAYFIAIAAIEKAGK